ncbi:MAG: hypothetical protein ACK4N6_03595 [Rhodocyclaceae bacterium]
MPIPAALTWNLALPVMGADVHRLDTGTGDRPVQSRHHRRFSGLRCAAGLDPERLPSGNGPKLAFTRATEGAKAWRDIWGSGRGVGGIDDIPTTAELIARLRNEYQAASATL